MTRPSEIIVNFDFDWEDFRDNEYDDWGFCNGDVKVNIHYYDECCRMRVDKVWLYLDKGTEDITEMFKCQAYESTYDLIMDKARNTLNNT